MTEAAGAPPLDVLLVNMPFAPVEAPSLGLTLLAGALERQGWHARVHYPNLQFVRQIGKPAYDGLSIRHFANTTLAGEWIFSRLVCPSGAPEAFAANLQNRLDGDLQGTDPAALEALCRQLPALTDAAAILLDGLEDMVARLRPRMIGFSSCFNQHLASLAAARRIRERFPEIFLVLGGANCTGPMGTETFRRFPFLDAVIAGPGEIALPDLVGRVLTGQPGRPMPGVYLRRATDDTAEIEEGHAPEPRLDDLPFPDYRDFFAEADPGATILIEGSRGCWWGQKHHCIFCSENAESMRYRGKSPARFAEELRWLTERHPDCRVAMTDEILDHRLLAAIGPDLARHPIRAGMFASVKANLSKAQVGQLAAAGIDRLQPGIESLDDDILGPMRKGVAAIRNVQLLKWCQEQGIAVSWAVLFGFPHDRPDPYRRMSALIPSLTHLAAPVLAKVSLQRFSPLFRDAADYGLGDVVPNDSYRFIYPFPPAALARLAYRFTARHDNDMPGPSWWAPLQREVQAWRQTAGSAFLFHQDEGERLFVCDTRPLAGRFLHVLTGATRAVYRACDAAQPLHAILRMAGETAGIDEAESRAALAWLIDQRLIIGDKGLYLALGSGLTLRHLPPAALMGRFLAAKTTG